MRKVYSRVAVASALALCFSVLVGTSAQAAIPTVRIEVGGLSKQIYMHAKLAESLGYYKKYGINVVLTDEAAGASAEDDMLTGSVDFFPSLMTQFTNFATSLLLYFGSCITSLFSALLRLIP